MPEQNADTVEILNRLFAEERRSLLPRLAECSPFVAWAEAAELTMLERMICEEQEHLAWLAEAIEQAGGAIQPVSPDATTSNLHYVNLSAAIPRVIAGVERVAALCAESLSKPGISGESAALISRIGQRHQHHLEQLKRIHTRARAVAPAR